MSYPAATLLLVLKIVKSGSRSFENESLGHGNEAKGLALGNVVGMHAYFRSEQCNLAHGAWRDS